MNTQILKLDEMEDKNLKEFIQTVASRKQILTIQLPNGEEVIIQPKPSLEPLPILEGYVPKGWKEEIYEPE